jgi:hypothetical protein
MEFFTRRPLYFRKRNPVPTEQEDGSQNGSGRFEEEKHLFPLLRLEPWTVQPVDRSLYVIFMFVYGVFNHAVGS